MSQICLKYFILIAEGCLPSPCLLAGKRFHLSRATLGLLGGVRGGQELVLDAGVSPRAVLKISALSCPVPCWGGSLGQPASLL